MSDAILFDPIKFLVKHTNYQPHDIVGCNKVSSGFSNTSFHVITKDQNEYQVRFGQHNDIISRSNERAIIQALKLELIYYNPTNGDSIRSWIKGKNPTLAIIIQSKQFFPQLVSAIQLIHNTKISDQSGIIQHDNYCFWPQVKNKLNPTLKTYYQKLTDKYLSLPRVLSHNDVSLLNIIYNDQTQQLTIIDFEWGRINNCYWDYANFLREAELDVVWWQLIAQLANLDQKILADHVFLTTFFAVQWAYSMPAGGPQLAAYTKKVEQLSWQYYLQSQKI